MPEQEGMRSTVGPLTAIWRADIVVVNPTLIAREDADVAIRICEREDVAQRICI